MAGGVVAGAGGCRQQHHVGDPEGAEYPALDGIGQGRAQVTREGKPQQVEAQLRVGVAAADVELERGAPDGAIESLDRGSPFDAWGIGQAGAMERQVAKGDRAAAPVREADGWRKKPLRQIVEREFAADDQMCQQCRGKDCARLAKSEPGLVIDGGAAGPHHTDGGGPQAIAVTPGGGEAAEGAVVDARDKGGADGGGVEGGQRRGWRRLCSDLRRTAEQQDKTVDSEPDAHSSRVGTAAAECRNGSESRMLAERLPTSGSLQPPGRPAPACSIGARPYIIESMSRLFLTVSLLALTAPPGLAQGVAAAASDDEIAPRVYVKQAMQAKVADSINGLRATWLKRAAEQPKAVAPRYALGALAHYDHRYRDAYSWLDSAMAVATTQRWRSAITRERLSTLIMHGEYASVPQELGRIAGDSALIPLDEWAEARLLQLVYARRQGGLTSLAALDSVDRIASPADTLLRARVQCLRAIADPPRRLAHAEAAIALANAAGLGFLSANCTLALASAYATGARMDSAGVWFDRADSAARAAHDSATLGATFQWRGYTLSSLGQIPLAMPRLAQAIRIAQRIDDRNVEAWALLGIANSAQQIGDANTASTALRRAVILFDATADRYGAANARLQRAAALIQIGDLEGASALARNTKAAGDSIRQPLLVLRSIYMLGDIALRTKRYTEVAALLDSARVTIRAMGPRYETQLNDYRGTLALNQGAYPEAIRLLDGSLQEYASGQYLFRHFVDGALSLAWLRSGDSVKAARKLVDAHDDLDRLRDTIATGGLRRVVAPPDTWGGASANLDHVLASFVTSRTYLPTVFAVTERARARALLKGSFGVVETDTTPGIAEARRRVRASATVLRSVQQSLAPGTALVVYAGGSHTARTSLMVISRTSSRGFTLAPLDSLDRDIGRWLALLESGESGTGAGRRVAQAVLSTALRGLPASIRRLVIVPQGALYRVPFQALPFGRGVLGDRAVVTVAPSVSLALAYAAEPRAVPARVLAFGAGDVAVASAVPPSLEINIERSQRGNPLAPLMAAAEEARAAADWGTGSIALTGDQASEASLKREAHGDYTVLHAAAHALTSDQALGANYLILRADSTDDGYVSGGELAALSSGRVMVVLSGCRTTGDFGSRGDAIDGLVAPLLARGVRTVVASHWAVSDRWTKVLMERFYRNLARGETTAEAMNTAQMSLRRENVPARFWAAFSVIGDGALTFTTQARSAQGK